MKLSTLRNGMVFKKVSKTTGSNHYEIADVLQDSVNGYTREIITLGNVSTKETTAVTISDLNNPRQWKEVKGAVVTEQTEVVKKVVFADGAEKVLDREIVRENQVYVESIPEKKKEPAQKTVIVNNHFDIKKAAQFKQAKDNHTNAMTSALANATVRKKPVLKETAKEPEDTTQVVYDKPFFWSLMKYTYDDIDILAIVVHGCVPIFNKIQVEPKKISKMVHQQELDAFRSGSSLREIRDMGNRIKALTPDQIGMPVSPQQIVRRILKAFYHYGTVAEKKSLRLI